MFGQNSVRSLHSLNSLTRSISGDIILTAVGAAASSSVGSGNRSNGPSANHHHHRSPPPRTVRPCNGNKYNPPRRSGSSSTSSSCSSGRAGVGTDSIVSLPRERHDRRPVNNSDEETRLSGYYGLMSLSNSSAGSQQSSMSSVTTATHCFPGKATTPTTATAPPAAAAALFDAAAALRATRFLTARLNHEPQHQRARAVVPATKLGRASTTSIFHQDIQLGPVLRAPVKSWTPTPPTPPAAASLFSTVSCPFPLRHSNTTASSTVSTSRPTATTTTRPTMIEIAPGVSLPLRGAEETQHAIAAEFYVQCECWACPKTSQPSSSSLHCILDCDYFLCPDCRSVAPNPLKVEGGEDVTCQTTNTMSSSGGGLGLGFRLPEQQATTLKC